MARRQAPPKGHDPSRREFFRTFGRQTLQNAGAVAGAAAELRRTSLAAARELLEVEPARRAQTRPQGASRHRLTPRDSCPTQPSAAPTDSRATRW